MRTAILSALCKEDLFGLSKIVETDQVCRRVRIVVKELTMATAIATVVDGELRVSYLDGKIRVPLSWLYKENEPVVVSMES